MKRQKILLYVASGATLYTFLGHTASLFMTPPEAAKTVLESMQSPVVPMPIGVARSYAEILRGSDISLSIFLLVAAISFFMLARLVHLQEVRKLIFIHALGAGALAIVSALYFFPLPAVTMGLAAMASLLALKTPKE